LYGGKSKLPNRVAARLPGLQMREFNGNPEAQGEMTFIHTADLATIERLPGWRGRYFDSANMSFAHYEFDAGASIHEHSHPQEEVYEVIAGELELTIGGVTERLVPGIVGIVPSNVPHRVRAITSGKLIVVDYPLRSMTNTSSPSNERS
jgi:quercetin dioxygenase-like cupin family protein